MKDDVSIWIPLTLMSLASFLVEICSSKVVISPFLPFEICHVIRRSRLFAEVCFEFNHYQRTKAILTSGESSLRAIFDIELLYLHIPMMSSRVGHHNLYSKIDVFGA